MDQVVLKVWGSLKILEKWWLEMGKLGEWEVEVGETPEVRPEGNGPGGVGSLGKPEEIGEVVVGNGEAWGVGGGSWGDT